ncbi:MAG TPA: TetR/AcrR family transcriptional regulator [Solirubrobacteraceae bacterium]|jgi:AcrR family transcriptional regulator|nr:TetR/AcrR family transcriptional regulator [Solirubrobacteraceae bacterium]
MSLTQPALADQPPPRGDTRARIILAGISQCEQIGLRRATMEDIARRAGLSRITLYRHFGGKDELVRAIVLTEAELFFEALRSAVAAYPRAEERVAEGFAFALDYLHGHALFQRLLRTEPEALLPHLVGDSYLVTVARRAVAPLIADERVTDGEAERVAELLVRLALSLALSPDSVLGADDHDGARRLARRYLVSTLPVRQAPKGAKT